MHGGMDDGWMEGWMMEGLMDDGWRERRTTPGTAPARDSPCRPPRRGVLSSRACFHGLTQL